jgi:hypothetical protein
MFRVPPTPRRKLSCRGAHGEIINKGRNPRMSPDLSLNAIAREVPPSAQAKRIGSAPRHSGQRRLVVQHRQSMQLRSRSLRLDRHGRQHNRVDAGRLALQDVRSCR